MSENGKRPGAEIVPIGRAERKVIEKAVDNLQDATSEHTEAADFAIAESKRLGREFQAEMAKPEWARRASVLEKLESEIIKNGEILDNLIEIGSTLMDAASGLKERDEFLIKREEEEGY